MREQKNKNNNKKQISENQKKAKVIMTLLLILIIIVIGIVVIVNINKPKEKNKGLGISNNVGKINQNETKEEYVSVGENGIKVNISDKIKEEKEIDGLIVTDMEITEVDNITTIIANIKNSTNEEKGDYAINIKLLDKSGNETATVPAYIGKIKPGQTMPISASSTSNLANAYNCEITK